MKSKNVLRRITSCALAASLCMTSIIPSYAADLSMEAQTEDVSTETVETTEESTESWSNPSLPSNFLYQKRTSAEILIFINRIL